jgi:hypothetical protein
VDGSRTLVFDIETHSAELIWSMPPKEFVRLIGYKWRGSDEVVLTTDLDELRERITCARWWSATTSTTSISPQFSGPTLIYPSS